MLFCLQNFCHLGYVLDVYYNEHKFNMFGKFPEMIDWRSKGTVHERVENRRLKLNETKENLVSLNETKHPGKLINRYLDTPLIQCINYLEPTLLDE